MRNAYLAVDAATDLRAHALDLRRRWEATFSGSTGVGRVRPVIAHSWTRMTGAGLDPARLRPRQALDNAALATARATTPLRHALPALRHHLASISDDVEHVMVVCDADGRVLWLEGHPRVLEQAQGITFRPGMLWTERSAGTNAIGTALAIEHPVQIFSAEHFLPEQHPWWCSAAPLRDPATGDLLGVVDVSGPQRTAHPYSLMLVSAAARIAGGVLRERQDAQDHRLRETYLDQIRRSSGTASALVDASGRVLQATPAGWLAGTITPPAEPGPAALPAGVHAEAEPLVDGAWVLRTRPRRGDGDQRRRWPRLDLCLLGRHGHTAQIDGMAPCGLSLRHAEVLALLALQPHGLTAEQLTLDLYGERGKAVTTRALMSRLRALLNGRLKARPYRLEADVHADFLEVSTLLEAGETVRALARYRGPLLHDSEVHRIVDRRTELAAALRRAALDGSADALWRWLETDHGDEDPEAMAAFLDVASDQDPRRAVVASRLEAVQQRWSLPRR